MRLTSSVFARTTLGLALGAVLTLSSCSKVDDMQKRTDDMDDTTKKMSNTTDGMAKTTDDMSKTTKRMEDTTCKMYTALRQGNSKASRDADMEAIRKGKNINEKLELAAKYMQGFEYQVWTESCADVAPRDIVIDQAATELLTSIQPYVKNRSKVGAEKQSKDYETLYAIAATLHRTNALQNTYLKGTDETPMQPLDIIVQGLKLNQAKNNGTLDDDTYPIWATTVGKYEKDAEFLLRLRGNFLMAYGYAVADSDSYGDAPKTLAKAWRLITTKISSKPWTPNLEKRDATEIRERITVSLKMANEVRADLTGLGIDPLVDKVMMKIWKDADFSNIDLGKMSKGDGNDKARAKAIKELITARDALVKGSN